MILLNENNLKPHVIIFTERPEQLHTLGLLIAGARGSLDPLHQVLSCRHLLAGLVVQGVDVELLV